MDPKAFFKISYGLYVLSARAGERDNGCITNTLMQVSGSPATVAFTVNKQNLTHDMIRESGRFAASVLTQDAPFELFKRFGFQSGRDTDKLAGLEGLGRTESGLFYLTAHTNAYLSGRVTATLDCGTHTLFYATVDEAQVLSDGESVTYGYYQSHIKPRPEKPKKTVWRCEICGYEYEGEELPADFICPLCKHPASDFVKVTV